MLKGLAASVRYIHSICPPSWREDSAIVHFRLGDLQLQIIIFVVWGVPQQYEPHDWLLLIHCRRWLLATNCFCPANFDSFLHACMYDTTRMVSPSARNGDGVAFFR